MSLKDYECRNDKFEAESGGLTRLDFPCNCCLHAAGTDDDEPCRSCGHNACSILNEPDTT